MPVLPASEAHFEFSVDVLVIGAGACGLSAALAAAEAGASVIVLERDAAPAGSTALSAGLIPGAGSRFQREAGIEDSPDLYLADLMAKAKNKTDETMARVIATQSAATVEWLAEKGVGMHLVTDFLLPGHSRHRLHGPTNQTGTELETALITAAAAAEIDIITEALARDLYADADGRIHAVSFARPDGNIETIGCANVILACNGFGGNPDLVERYIPEISTGTFFGHTGNKGDAVLWGDALGAALADMAAYQGHASVAEPHGVLLTWAVITAGGIQVNSEGLRFANEMQGYSEQTVHVLAQEDGLAWNIYDARCEVPALAFQDYRDLQESGAVRSAATPDELAGLTGLPAEALRKSIAETQSAARGETIDAFGRDFTLTPPLEGPWRAVRVTGGLFHTQGGLRISPEARVLRTDGTPLPNLFAGGGAARGVSGPASWYLAGNGLVTAVVFGRIAGQVAAGN